MPDMKKWILIGFLLLLADAVSAQSFEEAKAIFMRQKRAKSPFEDHYTLNESMADNYMLNDSLEVDRCRLEVVYSAGIVLDTIAGFRCNDVVVVQVGDSLQKFYSTIRWRRNMNHTLFQLRRDDEQVAYPSSVYQVAVDYEVYRDLKRRKFINRHSLYAMKNQLFEYEEPLPAFGWSIRPDTTTILGYICQRAEAEHAGRRWRVWFTPEIPVDGGLWKFNGLPGLILKAEDDRDHFRFTATEIRQPQKRIVHYRARTRRMTREAYRKLEARTFHNPFPTESYGIGITNPSTGKMEFLPLDWQMPYNPIELE